MTGHSFALREKKKKKLTTHDFIFTAYMLGFKDILDSCFKGEPITFGQAV